MAAMAGLGAKLIEVAALDRLKGVGDAVQFDVLRGVFPNLARALSFAASDNSPKR